VPMPGGGALAKAPRGLGTHPVWSPRLTRNHPTGPWRAPDLLLVVWPPAFGPPVRYESVPVPLERNDNVYAWPWIQPYPRQDHEPTSRRSKLGGICARASRSVRSISSSSRWASVIGAGARAPCPEHATITATRVAVVRRARANDTVTRRAGSRRPPDARRSSNRE